MKCSNCEQEEVVKPATPGLAVSTIAVGSVAYICSKCQENVLTLKIVLARRSPKESFQFEGYLPVSSER